jgi:hypothetical protein
MTDPGTWEVEYNIFDKIRQEIEEPRTIIHWESMMFRKNSRKQTEDAGILPTVKRPIHGR